MLPRLLSVPRRPGHLSAGRAAAGGCFTVTAVNGPSLQQALDLLQGDPSLPQDALEQAVTWLVDSSGVAHSRPHEGRGPTEPCEGTIAQFLRVQRCRTKPCTALLAGLGAHAEAAGVCAQAFAEAYPLLSSLRDAEWVRPFGELSRLHRPFERPSGASFASGAPVTLDTLGAVYLTFLENEFTRRRDERIAWVRSENHRNQLLEQAIETLLCDHEKVYQPLNLLVCGPIPPSLSQRSPRQSFTPEGTAAQLCTERADLHRLLERVASLSPVTLDQFGWLSVEDLVASVERARRDGNATEHVMTLLGAITENWRERVRVEIADTAAKVDQLAERYRRDTRTFLVAGPSSTLALDYKTLTVQAFSYELGSNLMIVPYAIGLNYARHPDFADRTVALPDGIRYGDPALDHAVLRTVETLWTPGIDGPYRSLQQAYEAALLLR